MPALKQDGPRLNSPWLTRRVGIMIALLSILLISLFYLEISRHGRANINLDLDQTPLTGGSSPDGLIPDTDLPAEAAGEPDCKVGDLYGSCFNDVRFFQCTPDGPLPHPCPAGQKFFCTGDGKGECDSRHSALGKGFEMVCHGKEELGACKKSD
ncbi:hypothetical protein Slin15195_G047720 [Septoria linicola]|uniref:Uncharacterized protein n=1 Tax=Septoria linicola TaxID=215465 RepID=A0A9Q9EJK9_9PEZI|nr:hypothetical protein Slin14017_G051260 [Septoria linicola]USW51453.1 hypothetical protein Slin15195_G047720 [Septoria linicola]